MVRPRCRMRASSSIRIASSLFESRLPRLAKVVYHNKIGNQLERVDRLRSAGRIARHLGADADAA